MNLAGPNLLDGIDLLIFDKDGTLIEFDLMWGGWLDVLGRGLEADVGLPLRERLFEVLGVDIATGAVHPHGLMAATPMSRIREVVQETVEGAGAGPAIAARSVEARFVAPDPVALAKPVTNLPALLSRLRSRVSTFAIATADDRVPTERTLAALGIQAEFAALACADDGIRSKPAPDPVLHVCGILGIAPGRTAVIGDSPADLRMARAAGAARAIGVLTGVSERATLELDADVVLESIAELAPE